MRTNYKMGGGSVCVGSETNSLAGAQIRCGDRWPNGYAADPWDRYSRAAPDRRPAAAASWAPPRAWWQKR